MIKIDSAKIRKEINNIPDFKKKIQESLDKKITELLAIIMGGAIIIIVVSHLLMFIVVPILLNGFFGVFVGSVQAFVFTMLYLTYTSVAVRSD